MKTINIIDLIDRIYADEDFLEITSEYAEMKTEINCKEHDIKIWTEDRSNNFIYTNEAQDIFNDEYDEIQERIIKLIKKYVKIQE